jgi:hypothetical protein
MVNVASMANVLRLLNWMNFMALVSPQFEAQSLRRFCAEFTTPRVSSSFACKLPRNMESGFL